MKKILVLCDYGQTRSVAMSYVLRMQGHFSVAGAYDNYKELDNTTESGLEIHEFESQFDQIIFLQEGGEHNIGRDEWGNCDNPELVMKCVQLAHKLGLMKK